MTTTTLPFTITVSRRREPAFRRGFHTVKSARLYAKELAGNSKVIRIDLSGEGIASAQCLYDAHAVQVPRGWDTVEAGHEVV